jgi:Rho termination factor, N-terminal domain
VAIERRAPRGRQLGNRLTQELVVSSVIDDRSAFDLAALALVVGSVLLGVFLIAFLVAFLPWLVAGALTAAVEGLMRRVGFSDFTANGIDDWLLVFLIGLVAIVFFVIVIVAIAAVANFLSARVSFRRFRGAAVRTNPQLSYDNRGPTAPLNSGSRARTRYEERTVAELHAIARQRDIPGRSQMNKAQLIRALRRR